MRLVPFVSMRVPVASPVMVLQEKVCPAVRRSTWAPVVICRVVREGLGGILSTVMRTVRGSSSLSLIVLEMVIVALVMRVERGGGAGEGMVRGRGVVPVKTVPADPL